MSRVQRSSDGGTSTFFVVSLKWNGAALQQIVARKQPQRNGTVVTLISMGHHFILPKLRRHHLAIPVAPS